MPYLDELIFNDRVGQRQGFSPNVCLEIMQLKHHLLDVQAHDVREMVDPRLATEK